MVFYATRNLVILRSARRARLEGCKARLQRLLCGGKEGKGRFAERFQRPQSAAAVELQRAQRVGFGQAFEGGAAEPAAAPQIGRIRVTGAARHDEPLGIGLGKSLDLAQAEAQRTAAAHSGVIMPARPGITFNRRPGESRDPRFSLWCL